MNICYLSKTFHCFRGGIESYTYNMSSYLCQNGHKVSIVASQNNQKFFHKINNNGVSIYHINSQDDLFPGSWRIDKIFPILCVNYSRKVAKKINQIIAEKNIEIVESPDWQLEGLCFSLNKKIPIVVRLHGYNSIADHFIFNRKMNFYFRTLFALKKKLLVNADIITAVSNNYANLIANHLNINREKIITIYNGIDINMFNPGQNQNKKPYILFVGRIHERKGVDIFLKAIPIVLREYPEVEFICIGADTLKRNKNGDCISYRKYISNFLNKNEIVKVKFLDPMPYEKLVDYFRNALCTAVPSQYEALPMTVIESMACGTTVIASNVGGIPEIIDDYKDGLLIEPNNYINLAKAILLLLKNSDLRIELSQAAIEKVRNNFTLKQTANQTLEIYSKVSKKFKHKY